LKIPAYRLIRYLQSPADDFLAVVPNCDKSAAWLGEVQILATYPVVILFAFSEFQVVLSIFSEV